MRRDLLPSIAVALVAALAGCSVDVEGARCDVVGSTDKCPAGQKCGNDLKCSVRAASCALCVAGSATQCRDGDVKQCSDVSDPVCGSWVTVTTCVTGQQTCAVPDAGGPPECACMAWTVVPDVRPPVAVCTQPAIKLAIDAAVRFPAPTVLLGGAAGATYGNELEDVAPIVVPAGVTLTGDATSAAATTSQIIAVRGTATAGLEVHPGAVVQGVAVQRGDPAGPTVGVLLVGGAAASGHTLLSVRVDGGGAGGAFATGLRIAGANAVAVADVLVKGATVAGLEVNRTGAADAVQVSQSNFDGNQVGVSLLKGDLTLTGSTVKNSKAEGVTSTSGAASLAIQDGTIARNGATGIFISAVQKFVLERTRVCGNTGTDRLYGGVTRKVGGLYSQGPKPPQLTFAGNRLHDNAGDQMYVVASTDTWNISGPGGCATGVPNVFAGYAAPGVGLAALASNVLALNNAWNVSFPTAGVDYAVTGLCGAGACQMDVGTGSGNVCLPVAAAELTCPPP